MPVETALGRRRPEVSVRHDDALRRVERGKRKLSAAAENVPDVESGTRVVRDCEIPVIEKGSGFIGPRVLGQIVRDGRRGVRVAVGEQELQILRPHVIRCGKNAADGFGIVRHEQADPENRGHVVMRHGQRLFGPAPEPRGIVTPEIKPRERLAGGEHAVHGRCLQVVFLGSCVVGAEFGEDAEIDLIARFPRAEARGGFAIRQRIEALAFEVFGQKLMLRGVVRFELHGAGERFGRVQAEIGVGAREPGAGPDAECQCGQQGEAGEARGGVRKRGGQVSMIVRARRRRKVR